MRRIAIDTGGTFTDCVLYDGHDTVLAVAKVPSQPKSPDRAIADGISRLLKMTGLGPADIDQVAHGTTIATNAVIQGRFARDGMITTQGCRDTLEIGTQIRTAPYNLRTEPKRPPIPRDLRIEVPGRLSAMGEEIPPLDEEAVRRAVLALRDKGAESVAVAGLFSLPREHWAQIASTNPLERVSREIKRRADVIGPRALSRTDGVRALEPQ